MSTHRFRSGDRITYKNPDNPESETFTGHIVTIRYAPKDPWHQVKLDQFDGEHHILPESGMKPVLKPLDWMEYTGISVANLGVFDRDGRTSDTPIDYDTWQSSIEGLTVDMSEWMRRNPLTVESATEHYEIREREILALLSRNLQEKIDEVQADIENHSELGEYAFDAGFTAGLRMAINEIESLTSKLTK